MKPSDRILKVYEDYRKLIMKTDSDWDANLLEIKQIHAATAEIAEILDELYAK